jgi:hypothetical protein
MTTFEILTLVAAVYASILSTILGIHEISKDKRNAKVSCTFGLVPKAESEMWKFIVVTIVNRGRRPIQVEGAGLLLNNGSQWTQMNNKLGRITFNRKLNDGESAEFFFDYEEVEKTIRTSDNKNLRYSKAFVRDAEGKRYTCKLPKALKDSNLSK